MAGIENNIMTNIPYSSSSSVNTQQLTSETKGKSYLEMDDFFQLMAAQLQNQDMTNPMDQSEFMNQLTMMSTIQSINEITNVSIVAYAASLVGKGVTIGEVGSDGSVAETYGTVTGTGMYSGEQVVFIDGKSYKLSQIMAVGKLPDNESDDVEIDEEDSEEDFEQISESSSDTIEVDDVSDSVDAVTGTDADENTVATGDMADTAQANTQ